MHTQKRIWTQTLYPSQKLNSKWSTALNVKCKTMKLLEHNIRENLDDLECGDKLYITWNVGSKKEKTDILDFIKIINFCSMEQKGPRGWKDKPQTQKTILLKDTLDKGMLSGIHEELLKLNTKKITWYNNGPKILTDTLPNKMTNKHIKNAPYHQLSGKYIN